MKRMLSPTFSRSKKVYCCWCRSILAAGSPRTVKKSAVRVGVAFANTNWCAIVVFPVPGGPATRLNEPSGTPPPRIRSSPGTPLASLSITTRFP
jgi:hypothetical protein